MATYGGRFESKTNIEERKSEKRKQRENVLHQAKKKYEDEERREAERKARGEHTWMLPEIDQRLQEMGQEHSLKKKKKEKSKKKKKEKKKKMKKEKSKQQEEDGSSDNSADSDEWVEAVPQSGGVEKAWKVAEQATPTASSTSNDQRDEWMTFDFLAMKTTSVAERRAQKEAEKEAEREKERSIEQAGLHRLELNPYWKDGGSGLPPEETAGTVVKKAVGVADAGLSWLRKSYQRMKEQAEREQRRLDDVVAERYGSMEAFQKRLQEAEEAAFPQRSERGTRDFNRHDHRDGEREERRHRDGERDQGRDQRQERERDYGRERERDYGRERERDYGRERERDYGREREREREQGREREREREQGRERERDRERDRDRDRERYVERNRDQERDRDKEKGRARDGERDSKQPKEFSLSSLKGRFLKPSDSDDLMTPGEGGRKPGMTATASSSNKKAPAFLKPRDEDDDEDVPAWRKSSGARDSKEKQEREGVREETQQPEKIQQPTGAALVEESSSESEEDDAEQEVQMPLLTDEEMNKLGAKLVKAELLGNTALMASLKAQLEAARKARENQAQKPTARPPTQVTQGEAEAEQDLVLFRTDHSGRAWPVSGPSQHVEPKGGRRKRKAIETHVAGERVRYFDDDDGMDLREMVRREKMSTAEDQNALYSRMAAKMMGKQDGDNYTLDDMFVSSAAQKERAGLDEDRQRSRAKEEARRLAGRLEKCPYCFTSPELPKHLIIAIGSKVYLSMPNCVSLTEGHCVIAPLQHHCCSTGLDEDVWSEMQVFRRALVRVFEAQDLDCVFLETHMNPKRRLHLLYECVPLPRELGDMAPVYFKKALLEADEEWAMNKKVVDLSSKNIRQSVPRGLPYFSVDFGLQGGFAHVIENEQKFPHYFGKEILGGMLDLEPRRWRKPIRENFDDQRKKVLEFSQWWKPFDCTKTDN
ncbi:CWF19-like protein 2 [Astyanax mexicanus]|uniref:CWF19-like protein 2 n=1 Tax=Astyanax mexicanus TaxID=7994 RepID=A0A8T2L063_ASTMX|nr:CWF19-like protein 2 [Astyanax mexicanus]